MPPLKHRAVSEQAAEFLAGEIIQQRLAGGEAIRETQWAEHLGLSRGSLREALLILERRHLVRIEPRRGARVEILDGAAAREIAEAWFLLLEAVLRDLAPRLGPRQRQELEGAVRELHALGAEDDPRPLHRAVMALALDCADWLGHRVFRAMLRDLLPAVQRCFYLLLTHLPEERDRTLAFIDGLLEQLRAGDGPAAAALVRDHARTEIPRLVRAARESSAPAPA